MNTKETYELIFPSDSGFDKSQIYFYDNITNLLELFYDSDLNSKSAQPRIFVTDTTIASLSSVKPLVDSFTQKWPNIYIHNNDVLIILGAGEKFKTIESVLSIVKAALDADFTRNCIFTAIGGGVICDMTGFAASIFKRGVPVEFVPTTLLAMVDASVGGKTGCDFDGYKNMIGTFYPAQKLYFFPDFVTSQSSREFKSGLAEAIKTALLFNSELCTFFAENIDKVLERDTNVLYTIIRDCVRAKADIVHKDLKEKGERAFLNLGHTFGHALEAVVGLGDITHGEGVAWGMARAAQLSLKLGLCKEDYTRLVIDLLDKYGYDTSPVHDVLKNTDNAERTENLLHAMHKDKKNITSDTIRFTLQKDICSTEVVEVEDSIVETVLI